MALLSSINSDQKICFYTALFNHTTPIDIPGTFKQIPKIDYILFTNFEPSRFANSGWTRIIQMEHLFENPILSAKTIKWQSHKYLAEYDIVIWLDAYLSPSIDTTIIWRDMITLVQNPQVDIIISKHPKRVCTYIEAEEVIKLGKDSAEKVDKNVERLEQDNYPKDHGLFNTVSFIRKNHVEYLNHIFDEMLRFMYTASHRDQLIVNYMFWKYDVTTYLCYDLLELMDKSGKLGKHVYFERPKQRANPSIPRTPITNPNAQRANPSISRTPITNPNAQRANPSISRTPITNPNAQRRRALMSRIRPVPKK